MVGFKTLNAVKSSENRPRHELAIKGRLASVLLLVERNESVLRGERLLFGRGHKSTEALHVSMEGANESNVSTREEENTLIAKKESHKPSSDTAKEVVTTPIEHEKDLAEKCEEVNTNGGGDDNASTETDEYPMHDDETPTRIHRINSTGRNVSHLAVTTKC